MNTIVAHDTPNVPLRLIGKANQAISISLMEQLKDPTINILNITLIGVSALGQMTSEEFYEGTNANKKNNDSIKVMN